MPAYGPISDPSSCRPISTVSRRWRPPPRRASRARPGRDPADDQRPDPDHRGRRTDHRPVARARQLLPVLWCSRRASRLPVAPAGSWQLDRRRRSGTRPVAVRRPPFSRRTRSSDSCTSARSKATAATTCRGPSPSPRSVGTCGAVRCMRHCERPVRCSAPSSAGNGRTGSRLPAPSRSTRPRSIAAQFDAVGVEHRAVRERVALIDMSSFSKYEVRGPGALALLQKLAANELDRPVGTVVYTQLCNEREASRPMSP